MGSEHHKNSVKSQALLAKGEVPSIGKTTNYRFHIIVHEMLDILASVVEEPILEDVHSSAAIGLEVDESTDVSVTRQLDLRRV